jgi:hypothetical protein
MRRLFFLFSCGLALWLVIGARDAVRGQRPVQAADDDAVTTLAERSHVVSVHFETALTRAGVRVRRVDDALGRAADGLNRMAGK